MIRVNSAANITVGVYIWFHFSVVYLRIITPTRGRGVRVRFKGYEKFYYEEKTCCVNERPTCYRDYRDYINYNEVLYQSNEPFSMCNTLFPFQIQLPSEIPGTFLAYNETEVIRWEAKVEYCLEVEVIDASQTLSVLEIIHICQPVPASCIYHGTPVACYVSHPVSFMLFFKRNVHIVARLHKHVHRTGEIVKLRIIITNSSSVNVQSIKIQLQRTITLTCRQRSVEDGDDTLCIPAESEHIVAQDQQINMINFPKGLDSIQIPLKDSNNRPLYPSVRGQHVMCEYAVLLTVMLTNRDTFELRIPISAIIAEKNKHWGTWKAPTWVTNDMSVLSSSDNILRVPANILSSEAFSSLPGFQPL